MPLISVIIPSYNHARFLPQCIESVLDQTYTDWELIIVDDGSSDNSVEIARSYADPRIQMHVNEQNLGTYGTENQGIELAKGEYIAILNSDDYWAPTKLEKQVQLLSPEIGFCYTLGGWVDASGNVQQEGHEDWPKTQEQDLLPYLLEKNLVLASSVIFPRNVGLFEDSLRYAGDWVMLIRLAARGPVRCVPEPLTFWRQHEANSYADLRKVFLEEMAIRKSILRSPVRWFAHSKSTDLLIRKIGRCALHLSNLYLLAGDSKNAARTARTGSTFLNSSLGWRALLLRLLPLSLSRSRVWKGTDPHEFERLYSNATLRHVELAPLEELYFKTETGLL